MRMRHIVVAVGLWAALAAPPAHADASAAPTLRSYLAKMGVHMNAYRAALTRADSAFASGIRNDVAISRLRASSAEFGRLQRRIKGVRAPEKLGTQHKKIVQAIGIVASAFKGFADARVRFAQNRDTAALVKANTREQTRLKTAEGLQRAWARALLTRTVRAGLRAPQWLRDFFT